MAKEHCRIRRRYLPEELQEKILVQLPVKSLRRFESVSKAWRSMFHSRSFIDLYGIRCPRLVFYTSPYLQEITRNRVYLHRHDGKPEVRWRRVESALGPLSNGMYCVTSHSREEYSDFMCTLTGNIGLCNPSTRYYKDTKHIPFEIYLPLSDKIVSFNPSRANVGFGKINPSSDQDYNYKVVVLISHGKSLSSFLSLVYNHQSGKWKIVEGKAMEEAFNIQGRRIIEISNPLELRPQRFLEGCWHWIAKGEDQSFNVLSFNFGDEAFRLIGAPLLDHVRNESCSVKAVVSVLHDRLVVIYLLYNELSHCVEVDVWMMMEYGVEESWTKMYNINPNSDGDRFERHLGIDYSTRRDEESGCVRIESLSFSDFDKQQIDLLL